MEFQTTPIPGLIVVKPRRFGDKRGYFMETYNRDLFAPAIGEIDFMQDNESFSTRGVLRGLHLQKGEFAQAKLVRVVEGEVFDVVVDVRPGSKTYGKWFSIELSQENGLMLFIPRGFAHGFLVLSATARFVYKVDNRYAPESEVTISYDDPELGIQWPSMAEGFILSERDVKDAISFGLFSSLQRID